MKTPPKHLMFRERGLELVRMCNEKMVCAARDLAEFTKNGINAAYIVSLAYKCDELAESLQTPKQPDQPAPSLDKHVAAEIWTSVSNLCETGRKIFQGQPAKYNDYVIPVAEEQA